MIRRNLLKLAVAGCAECIGCASARSEVDPKLVAMMTPRDLAIIPDLWTGGPIPKAISGSREFVGNLQVPGNPWWISISPDCNWIAWVPARSLPPPMGTGDAEVLFANSRSDVKKVRVTGGYPARHSVSSGASRIALIRDAGANGNRLIVLNPWTGEIECEVAEVVSQLGPRSIERVRISGTGEYVAVGTRERFVVLEIPSCRVLFEEQGRFPCLSPDGDSVAFIDKGEDLIITSIRTRGSRKVANWSWSTLGLGYWSPDGEFLLAGMRRRVVGFFIRLAAIDCATGEFTEIVPRLAEGDQGEQSAWVHGRFLTAAQLHSSRNQ
jgi:hypothetical protein